ncbi:MAG TPA: hypothetical protein PLV42_01195 [bacterium]|nr:hypothetical protein [bacterium]
MKITQTTIDEVRNMNRKMLAVICGALLFSLFTACSTPEETEDIFCESILDCPEGMDCVDYTCVEMTVDTKPADKDTATPDTVDTTDLSDVTDVTDDIIVDTEPVDDQPVVDEDSVDVVPTDDQPIIDEDGILPDTDKLLNDGDELLVEEPADEDVVADDTTVTDSDTVLPSSVTIGDGTDTQWIPIGCRLFPYSRSAGLYLAAEIGYSATITKLAWYDETGAATSRPIKIYLKETTDASLSASTWDTQTTGATVVFEGDITTVAGWNEFTLTTPFVHSGENNLLVLVEMNKKDTNDSDSPANRYTDAPGLHEAWNENYIPTDNGSVDGSRPNITISF